MLTTTAMVTTLSNNSLNAEVTADLDNSFIVEPDATIDETGGQAVVVSTDDSAALENEPEIQEAIASLDGYQTAISTTIDGHTKVRDMNEVTSTILASESISRSDAQAFANIFPDLMRGNYSNPNSFTEVPSKIGYDDTIASVEQRKTEHEQEVNNLYESLDGNEKEGIRSVADIYEVLTTNIRKKARELEPMFEELANKASGELALISQPKNKYNFCVAASDNNVSDYRKVDFGTGINTELNFKISKNINTDLRQTFLNYVSRGSALSKMIAMGSSSRTSTDYDVLLKRLREGNLGLDSLSRNPTDSTCDFSSYEKFLSTLSKNTLGNYLHNSLPMLLEFMEDYIGCKSIVEQRDEETSPINQAVKDSEDKEGLKLTILASCLRTIRELEVGLNEARELHMLAHAIIEDFNVAFDNTPN